jgi:hypothetical protein
VREPSVLAEQTMAGCPGISRGAVCGAQNLVLHVGVDVARLRNDPAAVLRALYRTRLDPAFPVI